MAENNEGLGINNIAGSVAGQVLGNTIGNVFSQIGMGNQVNKAKQLAVFNRQQQMQLWRDTNYLPQTEQMKKAGLNVGLMYKGSGAGGTTATNAGQMPTGNANYENPMALAIGMRTAEANLKVAEAQARNLNAEAEVKEQTGVEKGKAEIGNLIANTGNAIADTQLKNVNTEIQKINQEITEQGKTYSIYQIMANAEKSIGEASSAMTKANVDKATAETQIKTVEQNYANLIVQNSLMQMGIKLDAQKIEESKKLVEKMANDIEISKGQLNLNEWTEEVKANYPSIFNVLGGKVDQVVRSLQSLLSGGTMPTERKYGK